MNKYRSIKEAVFPHMLYQTLRYWQQYRVQMFIFIFLMIMKKWKNVDDIHRSDSMANESLKMWIYLAYK